MICVCATNSRSLETAKNVCWKRFVEHSRHWRSIFFMYIICLECMPDFFPSLAKQTFRSSSPFTINSYFPRRRILLFSRMTVATASSELFSQPCFVLLHASSHRHDQSHKILSRRIRN